MSIRPKIALLFLVAVMGCSGNSSRPGSEGGGAGSAGRNTTPTSASTHPRTSLAILPFSGTWDKPGDAIGADWDGKVSEMLSTTLPTSLAEAILAKSLKSNVTILSTDTVKERLKAAKVSPDAEARRVLPETVKAVLVGHVAKDGKLTVQLVDAESGNLLWSKTYQLVLATNLLQNSVTFGLATPDHAEVVAAVVEKLAQR
jgi:TolB-like protein